MHLYKDGKSSHAAVHRLVAEAYIPNPNNLPVVDHIDDNPFNNQVSNLQWFTTQQNVHKSYNKISQVRNFIECKLYKGNILIGTFKSIAECCRYCANKIGLSYSSMYKYHKYKDYVIKV